MPWGMEIGPIASVVAAFAAITSAWIAFSLLRRQTRSDLPLIAAVVRPRSGDWYEFQISVKNRSAVAWHATGAVVVRPRAGKVIRLSELSRPDSREPWNRVQLPIPDPATLSNKTEVGLVVQAAGTRGDSQLLGTTDRYSEALLVYAPPSKRPIKFSIRLGLASSDAAQRTMTVMINRTINAGMANS